MSLFSLHWLWSWCLSQPQKVDQDSWMSVLRLGNYLLFLWVEMSSLAFSSSSTHQISECLPFSRFIIATMRFLLFPTDNYPYHSTFSFFWSCVLKQLLFQLTSSSPPSSLRMRVHLRFVEWIPEGLASITSLSLCFSIGILKYLFCSCLRSFFKAGVWNHHLAVLPRWSLSLDFWHLFSLLKALMVWSLLISDTV